MSEESQNPLFRVKMLCPRNHGVNPVNPLTKCHFDNTGGDGTCPTTGRFFKVPKSRTPRVFEDLESPLYQRPVFSQYGHDVGDSAQGNQIQQSVQVLTPVPIRFDPRGQRLDQLEGDSDTGKPFEWIRAVNPVRIDDAVSGRQRVELLVVVHDDHIDARFRRQYPVGPIAPGNAQPDKRVSRRMMGSFLKRADTLEADDLRGRPPSVDGARRERSHDATLSGQCG